MLGYDIKNRTKVYVSLWHSFTSLKLYQLIFTEYSTELAMQHKNGFSGVWDICLAFVEL